MDKYIDKLIDTSWFMKIVALLLALLLFDSVYDPDKQVSNVNIPGDEDTAVLEDVPVKAYYDTENLVVSGIPETVTVTLQGPKSHLQPAKAQRNFEVFVDLADAEIGEESVPIEIKDISDKLDVIIDPSVANVTIQERVSKDFRVEAEFNNGILGEGFVAESAIAEPNTVTITGAMEDIESIGFVKATLNISGPITESVKEDAVINVLDREMNKLNVKVEPSRVEVKVEVSRISKTVPINIVEKGEPSDDVNIESLTLDVDEATIYGKKDVLEETEAVRVEVDLSKLDGDTELTLPVIISEGITEVNPKQVKLKVKANKNEPVTENNDSDNEQAQEQETKRTYSNIPINITGLADDFEAEFKSPTGGRTSLTAHGRSDKVNSLKEADFNLFLNLAGLDEGEHEVEININGPSDINLEPDAEKATIAIKPREV
ncbi:CdaR family protein [Cytobacillus purgationiresistens]|uniref:YbbR domain-containing protein n=1 Tax=Cytobacillus purgationiresistens TaxID=863449 RepID=A0ABU0AHC3_9BACI|nr:CdaR family protein [Cytobacillus purgationiresistens]MDQ0270657.1 YbbR domain-containing protein [Cytobacillus purgationiresistens]